MPNAPHFVDGVVFSRGEVVPAINLRARFGFERVPYDMRTRLFVVQRGWPRGGPGRRRARANSSRSRTPRSNRRTKRLAGLSGKYLRGIADARRPDDRRARLGRAVRCRTPAHSPRRAGTRSRIHRRVSNGSRQTRTNGRGNGTSHAFDIRVWCSSRPISLTTSAGAIVRDQRRCGIWRGDSAARARRCGRRGQRDVGIAQRDQRAGGFDRRLGRGDGAAINEIGASIEQVTANTGSLAATVVADRGGDAGNQRARFRPSPRRSQEMATASTQVTSAINEMAELDQGGRP